MDTTRIGFIVYMGMSTLISDRPLTVPAQRSDCVMYACVPVSAEDSVCNCSADH